MMQEFKISLSKPIIDQEMIDAVTHALKDEMLVRGKSVVEFENGFKEFVRCKHAIAVNSGTTALHISLIAAGVKRGDRVATTTASFIATANAIRYVGAIPVFIDISLKDYNMDCKKLEEVVRKYKIKAVIPVHLYGYPVDMDEILRLKDYADFILIEDACQAHGASYNDRMVGSFGSAAAFSFYPSKNITVGGDGGMITTNDDEIAKIAYILRDVGRFNGEHITIGFTARMNTINAAIGKIQLRHLTKWLEKRNRLADYYLERLNLKEIILPPIEEHKKHAWHLFVIRYKKRDRLRLYLEKKGIEVGIHYKLPIHLQKPYRDLGYCEGMFPNAERWCREVLSLPLHPNLTFEELDYIIDSIREFVRAN